MKKLIIAIAVFGLLVGHVFAKMPDYKGFVNDFSDVLSPKEEMQIEQRLTDYEKKTTNEIAVVTVKTTQPDSIEQYSINLADQWKPGKVGKDNGVIMLFAMDDRKMRIEVGRGLEGDLTDIETKHIQDDIIRPEFKSSNYAIGINKGLDAVIADLSPELKATVSASTTTDNGNVIDLIIILVVVGGVVLLALSPHTPLGGEGDGRIRGVWVPKKGSKWGKRSIGVIEDEHYIPVPFIPSSRSSNEEYNSPSSSSSNDDDDDSSSSGGSTFGGGGMTFGGGSFSGGGSSSSW